MLISSRPENFNCLNGKTKIYMIDECVEDVILYFKLKSMKRK